MQMTADQVVVIGNTVKGYWPAAVNGKIEGYGDQLIQFSKPSLFHEDEFGVFRGARHNVLNNGTAWNSKAFTMDR